MKIIDTHAHLDYYRNEADFVQTINDLLFINTISTKINEFDKIIAIAEKYHNVYCSIGQHPNEVTCDAEIYTTKEIVSLILKNRKIIAIGETGLDYYRKEHASIALVRKLQLKSLQNHIEASVMTNKPIIIHNRNSDSDMINILRDNKIKYGEQLKGVIHSFTGNEELMHKFLDLDFYISFSGIVTFKNAKDVQDCARKIPAERLLIETDSPFLAPVPHRGEVNNPSYVKFIADFIANLRNENLDDLIGVVNSNAIKLFNYS